jgi:hypothetical protein
VFIKKQNISVLAEVVQLFFLFNNTSSNVIVNAVSNISYFPLLEADDNATVFAFFYERA